MVKQGGSNSTRGLFGVDTPPSNNQTSMSITHYNATTGNATDFGDLSDKDQVQVQL